MKSSALTEFTEQMCGRSPATASIAETFPRTVRFDAVLHSELVTMAGKLGYAVSGYGSGWRTLSLRLSFDRRPVEGDTRLGILRLGLYGAAVAPDFSVFGRLSWEGVVRCAHAAENA